MQKHYQELKKNKANYIPLSPLSFLARTADIFGARTSIVYEDRHYSWQQTFERSRAIASALTSHGLGLGDTVSIEFCFLGVEFWLFASTKPVQS